MAAHVELVTVRVVAQVDGGCRKVVCLDPLVAHSRNSCERSVGIRRPSLWCRALVARDEGRHPFRHTLKQVAILADYGRGTEAWRAGGWVNDAERRNLPVAQSLGLKGAVILLPSEGVRHSVA